jgi:hypothetical protein
LQDRPAGRWRTGLLLNDHLLPRRLQDRLAGRRRSTRLLLNDELLPRLLDHDRLPGLLLNDNLLPRLLHDQRLAGRLLDYRRLLHCHWLPRLLDDHRLPGRLHHHNLTGRLLDHRRLDSARLKLHDRRLRWLLDHKRLPWLLVNDRLVRLLPDKLLPRLLHNRLRFALPRDLRNVNHLRRIGPLGLRQGHDRRSVREGLLAHLPESRERVRLRGRREALPPLQDRQPLLQNCDLLRQLADVGRRERGRKPFRRCLLDWRGRGNRRGNLEIREHPLGKRSRILQAVVQPSD